VEFFLFFSFWVNNLRYLAKLPQIDKSELKPVITSVADPDPGSGAFLPLDPGSGMGFFRIPDPKPIFLRAW
jgi:hypothetical protein